MVFEHIEKLKQQYTDQYVIVDKGRPELSRFGGRTGQVRTVNMSGRALVEFEGDLNIGWYDIEVDFLKVVDKPAPKEKAAAKKTTAKKTPVAKEPSALEKARASGGKKTAGSMSVADMLAAARGKKDPSPAKAADTKSMSVADVLAAARKPTGGSAPSAKTTSAKLDPKSMSVADMLAAARSGAGSGASPTPKETPGVVAVMEAARRPSETVAPADKKIDSKAMSVADMLAAARGEKAGAALAEPAKEVVETETAAPAAVAASDGPLPTETAEIIVYCRQRDSE